MKPPVGRRHRTHNRSAISLLRRVRRLRHTIRQKYSPWRPRLMRGQDMYPFGPRAMVIVSWYLAPWIGLATRGISEGNQDELLRRVRQMFDPDGGGLGIEDFLSASSHYDWEIGAENETMGIAAFESGSLFIVESEDLTMQPIPVRIFTPRMARPDPLGSVVALPRRSRSACAGPQHRSAGV